jgi:glycosyltransferase involved in cell wall biosynthesis
MRVFYIEPSLRKTESHFVEHTLAIYSYLKTRRDVECHVIGNKSLNQDIVDLFPGVLPVISQTNFENLNDNGLSFYADLKALDKRFSFTADDLLIIPTAYSNQVLGATFFSEYVKSRCPMISMQFHQLFPPKHEIELSRLRQFHFYWLRRLLKAFRLPSSSQITYWTTESRALNTAYRRLTRKPIGQLSVPYDMGDVFIRAREQDPSCFRIGFVGDGREEKGLFYFLRACERLAASRENLRFVLQLNNLRGYSYFSREQLEREINKFEALPNVEVIRGGLAPAEHHALIRSLDIVVLPYDSAEYSLRISGLFVQAAILGRPIILSDSSWAADELRQNRAAGVLFDYVRADESVTVTGLTNAIARAVREYARLSREATSRAVYYQSRCEAGKYFGAVLSRYGYDLASSSCVARSGGAEALLTKLE